MECTDMGILLVSIDQGTPDSVADSAPGSTTFWPIWFSFFVFCFVYPFGAASVMSVFEKLIASYK